MKNNILSIIALITTVIPFTVVFFWNPTDPNATAVVIGYCIFITISFIYSLFLFTQKQKRNMNTKIAFGINSLYFVGILFLVVIPRLI